LAKEPFTHQHGVVAIPQAPGLGIEINRAVLEKFVV